ncbi:hypothetical protein CcaverHIS002_0102730 [Cutaneotrichosporon cavernicola]|nr:hypothetical protein CcaverHIS002_0102730 [Cutaneotrichosporon cavernicola]
MASRLAIRSLRVARPAVVPRALVAARGYASQPTPRREGRRDHQQGALTAGVLGITGLSAAAISNELYVANEETVLAAAFLIIFYAIAKNIGAPYTSWANGHIDRIRGILNGAREQHTAAVSQRLDGLESLKDVVPLTEQLYAVAKETNQLEHSNFLLEQEAAVKGELKAVLDSWVRYEQQAREAEQTALVKTVSDSINAELAKPAFKKALLDEAIANVEAIAKRA